MTQANFTLTPAAAAKIAALLEGRPGAGLRIQFEPGGCCGTYYAFTLDMPVSGDVVDQGVLMALNVADFLAGARLDYGARLKPPRFRILRNLQDASKCPCGRSFGDPYPGKMTPYCQAYQPMDF